MTSDLDIIIAGGGRVGFQTAEILADRGHDVTIIERDDRIVSDIADQWIATVIQGDATNPDIIEQAGLERADVIAALTGETGLNLAVCLAAAELTPDIRTVARIDRTGGESYTRFVDAVVFPERAGSRVAANEIIGSDVQTLADVTGNLDIMLIRVADDAPAAGKPLSDVRFPEGTLVVSDANGERIARADTTLTPGSSYVVAVEPAVVDEVMHLMRG
ncbi:NAD-binding protein [Haloarcula sp. KBTZ06]|uniref:TrkA family potassium uptake protein n=1 Tax=Haloarcula hispanica TaxID=51589 RepID=A0A5J5LJD0_HALHI|nr:MULTISPECIES: TrkA family potassium uptake protein [Haloarcula]AJF26536.1 potassium transporter Trk [Haloarcula sp. CBA1115]KAA9407638.1 TrkA family potassium uptake protein [Haloarcula sp. CBA1131]KAA9409321.1 TrkA family potassium uptake protein [Haloarcula hispanica]KZX47712.1 potassium transporter Trk [Haloarcula sp. K1]MUV51029.1 NAD(P)H-binding protein [Haloarcula sp. CBA1122]